MHGLARQKGLARKRGLAAWCKGLFVSASLRLAKNTMPGAMTHSLSRGWIIHAISWQKYFFAKYQRDKETGTFSSSLKGWRYVILFIFHAPTMLVGNIVCDRKIYGRNNGRYYGRKAYGRNVSALFPLRWHQSFKMRYIEAKSFKIWLSYKLKLICFGCRQVIHVILAPKLYPD